MPRKSLVELAEETPPGEILKRDRRIRELEEKLKRADAGYRHAIDQLKAAEQRADFSAAMDDRDRDPIAWERESKRDGTNYCAIAIASDWHIAETIDPKTVNGLNRFDQAIAAKRVRKFFLKIPEYVERYAPAAKLLYLWAGGDFISGAIHPDLAESNSLSPTEECLWFRELWSDGLATLLKAMPSVRVIVPTNYGNHGRTTQKPRINTAADNSFEQMTYKVLARDWRNEPRVQWRISSGYHNVQTICGRRVRFHHGDAIKYGGGVGGITIPVRKAIAQWNKSHGADLDIFGHFHEWIDGNSFVCNGSLVGYGPFSLAIKAEYQPPVQGFLVFDGKHGLRQSTRIFVGDE